MLLFVDSCTFACACNFSQTYDRLEPGYRASVGIKNESPTIWAHIRVTVDKRITRPALQSGVLQRHQLGAGFVLAHCSPPSLRDACVYEHPAEGGILTDIGRFPNGELNI